MRPEITRGDARPERRGSPVRSESRVPGGGHRRRDGRDDQRAALEDVPSGRAGGILAAAADTHVERAEVATAPFSSPGTGRISRSRSATSSPRRWSERTDSTRNSGRLRHIRPRGVGRRPLENPPPPRSPTTMSSRGASRRTTRLPVTSSWRRLMTVGERSRRVLVSTRKSFVPSVPSEGDRTLRRTVNVSDPSCPQFRDWSHRKSRPMATASR